MKTTYLFIFVFLLLVGSVSAEFLGDDYPINEDYRVYLTCDECISCNMTRFNFGSEELLNRTALLSDGTYWETIINSGNLSKIGSYEWCYECTNGLLIETGCNYFKTTSLGISQSTAQSISSAIFLLLMIFLTVFFAFIGYFLLKTKNLWILGIFIMFLSLILIVYDTWLGYQYHKIFTGLSDSKSPEIIFYSLLLLLVFGGLSSIALLATKWREIFKYIKKEMRRKEEDDSIHEDWDIDDPAWR